jgi:hypothetical protein
MRVHALREETVENRGWDPELKILPTDYSLRSRHIDDVIEDVVRRGEEDPTFRRSVFVPV